MRNGCSSWRSLGVLNRSLQTPGTSFTGYQIVAKLPLKTSWGKPLVILFFPTDCHFGTVSVSSRYERPQKPLFFRLRCPNILSKKLCIVAEDWTLQCWSNFQLQIFIQGLRVGSVECLPGVREN